jgi:hypothetical protein
MVITSRQNGIVARIGVKFKLSSAVARDRGKIQIIFCCCQDTWENPNYLLLLLGIEGKSKSSSAVAWIHKRTENIFCCC